MAIFFTRQRIVDPQGGGTDTTIQAAINACTPDVNTGNFWQVLVAPGIYTENLVVPSGVCVQGAGGFLTQIRGKVDLYPATQLTGLYIDNTTVPGPYTLGLRYDTYANNFYVHNCIIYCAYNQNGVSAAVEVTGVTTAICRFFGCILYGANRITTTAALAKAVVLNIGSDFTNSVEIYGSNLKTSTGLNGVAESICVLNKQTGSGGVALGYARIAGSDWGAAYAGVSPTPPPVLLDSAHTTHPGGELDVSCWNPTGLVPTVRSAYLGTPATPNAGTMGHSQLFHRLTVEREYKVFSGGVNYPVPPGIILDHTPTVADPAPDGTVAYVV